MKICDLTQFYSPVSGGVKRYVSEKVRYLREHSPGDEHLLIIPGERDGCEAGDRTRVYTVASPLLSEISRYRILLRLQTVEAILARERPDVIESGDPYQVGWQALRSGRELGVPVLGFYHSHFPEAYLRTAEPWLGAAGTGWLLRRAQAYVRRLYNRGARTLVPSPALGALLTEWGVRNVVPMDLGVNLGNFHPAVEVGPLREELGLPPAATLLLYVGRLAYEKNTQTLFAAFRELCRERSDLHLLVIGDGLQRPELEQLRQETRAVTWLPYCGDPALLARCYRAARLLVHPGVQETFGLVTVEAQACGTPVLGIRGSYMDRLIHEGLEHWAAENTPASLAGAIATALAAPRAVGAEALSARIAARYSWSTVFHGLFDLYRTVSAEYAPAAARHE